MLEKQEPHFHCYFVKTEGLCLCVCVCVTFNEENTPKEEVYKTKI